MCRKVSGGRVLKSYDRRREIICEAGSGTGGVGERGVGGAIYANDGPRVGGWGVGGNSLGGKKEYKETIVLLFYTPWGKMWIFVTLLALFRV